MSVNPSAFSPKPQFVGTDGLPMVGAKLFAYVGGSVNTKQNTFSSSTGLSANPNPIILNALGEPPNEWWWTSGLLYKIVLAPSTDTDPPSSPIWTIDNLRGQNDVTSSVDQWQASGITPTFVSGTSFTLPGDQTSNFTVGRRLKFTVTAGTVYGTIATSVFGALTTVTMTMDAGQVLDSGLSAVQYGLLTPNNISIPNYLVAGTGISITYTSGKPTIASTAAAPTVYRSAIQGGLVTALAGTSTTATSTITAGQGTDSTYASIFTAAAFSWAVANGNAINGYQGGTTLPNSNTIHVFWIATAADTTWSASFASLSPTAPTLPGGYIKFIRIGSFNTTGAGAPVPIIPSEISGGATINWLTTQVLDVNNQVPNNAARTLYTLSVPTGIKVSVKYRANANGAGTNSSVILTSGDETDVAPNVGATTGWTTAPGSDVTNNGTWMTTSSDGEVYTNTSGQIGIRSTVGAGLGIYWVTRGWIDFRRS